MLNLHFLFASMIIDAGWINRGLLSLSFVNNKMVLYWLIWTLKIEPKYLTPEKNNYLYTICIYFINGVSGVSEEW